MIYISSTHRQPTTLLETLGAQLERCMFLVKDANVVLNVQVGVTEFLFSEKQMSKTDEALKIFSFRNDFFRQAQFHSSHPK